MIRSITVLTSLFVLWSGALAVVARDGINPQEHNSAQNTVNRNAVNRNEGNQNDGESEDDRRADDKTRHDEAVIVIDDAQVSLIQNTSIATPIAGIVLDVYVETGDSVQPGDRLIQLDPEQAETELLAARAALEAARLQADSDVDARYAQRTMEVSQRELDSGIRANEQLQGSLSASEIAELELSVDQARLALEQASHRQAVARATAEEKRAAVRMAETRLRQHRIDSPVAGMCVEVSVEPGEWVHQGDPVARMISLNPIRVECFIDGRAYGPELVGCPVIFTPATGQHQASDTGASLHGHITFVSPELHPITGESRVWATLKNPELIARSGMRGQLQIQLNQTSEPSK